VEHWNTVRELVWYLIDHQASLNRRGKIVRVIVLKGLSLIYDTVGTVENLGTTPKHVKRSQIRFLSLIGVRI